MADGDEPLWNPIKFVGGRHRTEFAGQHRATKDKLQCRGMLRNRRAMLVRPDQRKFNPTQPGGLFVRGLERLKDNCLHARTSFT